MNIHETYVSLEVAKLLKQAGFDWECEDYWMRYVDDEGDELGYTDEFYLRSGNSLNWNDKVQSMSYYKPDVTIRFSAPTLSMARRYIREVLDVDIVITTCKHDFGNGNEKAYCYECNCITEDGVDEFYENTYYYTYEGCESAAVQFCLETIIKDREKNETI